MQVLIAFLFQFVPFWNQSISIVCVDWFLEFFVCEVEEVRKRLLVDTHAGMFDLVEEGVQETLERWQPGFR